MEGAGTRLRAVESGTIKTSSPWPLSRCLARLREGIEEAIERTGPAAAAIEGVFFCRNARTALTLGEARGVALSVCIGRGLPVYEYAPRRVKQAVVGYGGAGKEQVQRMVMKLLALPVVPPEDEGDALAIAICHLHACTGQAPLMPKPI